MKLTTTAINDYGESLKIIDIPALSNFERVAPKQVPNDGEAWLVMEMHNLQDGLYSSVPNQCDSLNNDYQYVTGKTEDGEWMLFTGLAIPLQNTIESPLLDGGLQAGFEGARACSNVPKNFMNIESCSLSSGEACQASDTVSDLLEWQEKAKNNVVICGSEGEVTSDVGIIDPSKPMFALFGHNHNLLSGMFISPFSRQFLISLAHHNMNNLQED